MICLSCSKSALQLMILTSDKEGTFSLAYINQDT